MSSPTSSNTASATATASSPSAARSLGLGERVDEGGEVGRNQPFGVGSEHLVAAAGSGDIHLHPETVAELKRRKAEQAAHRLAMGDPWPGPGDISYNLVFTWADWRLIRPDTLTRIIARMSARAEGLSRITPHGLRHSHATAALTARVPVKVVADRLGNTVRVVEEIYAHVIPSDDQDAAQVVGDLYRQPKTAGSDPQI